MASSVQLTQEELDTLNTGRSFASLEQSPAYKAQIGWIKGFAKEARRAAREATSNDSYQRFSVKADAAEELVEMIENAIAAIKFRATDLAANLKRESETE